MSAASYQFFRVVSTADVLWRTAICSEQRSPFHSVFALSQGGFSFTTRWSILLLPSRVLPPASVQGNQGLKPEGRVAQPPFNLVIVTKMNRTYYSNGEKNCKLSNVYFQCRLKCVRQKQPYFLPPMCKIPPNLTPFLLPCHRDILNNL